MVSKKALESVYPLIEQSLLSRLRMLLSLMKRLVGCSNPSVSEDRHNVNEGLMLITDNYFYDARQRSFAPQLLMDQRSLPVLIRLLPLTVLFPLYTVIRYDFLTSLIYTLTFTVSSRLPTPYYVLFYFGLFLIRWALNLKFNSRFHLKTVIRWNYVLPLGPAVYSQFSECC